MTQKTVKIDYKGKQEEVTIRKMGWAEKNDLMERNTETIQEGKKSKITMHPFKIRNEAFKACYVTGPFSIAHMESETDDESMRAFEFIYQEIEKYNKISEETKKKLEKPPATEQKTQQ